MSRTRLIITLFVLILILSACSSSHLYLVKQPNVTTPRDIGWKCLSTANFEIASGLKALSDEERALFKGNDVKYFLWWGSLSGPRPVVDTDGYISEARSMFALTDKYKIDLTERYVLCLFNHGYMWPDEESVQKRFK